MFLIFGNSISESLINVVAFICHFCGQNAPQNVMKRANRITLFFIPLIPLSTKYHNRCTNCGGVTPLTAEQAKNSLAWSESRR